MDSEVKVTGDFLTLPEVAASLRMSVHTLRSPAWLARLGAVKVAGKYLVPAETVTEVLSGKR